MKFFTLNLSKFGGTLVLLTLAFRFGLSTALSGNAFTISWFIAILYAAGIFLAGWVFGKRDYESLPLYDIGFRFHLTTYVICNGIGELWFLSGFQSQHETISVVHLTALFWGIGLIIHFLFFLANRKNSIKGIEKTEIFE